MKSMTKQTPRASNPGVLLQRLGVALVAGFALMALVLGLAGQLADVNEHLRHENHAELNHTGTFVALDEQQAAEEGFIRYQDLGGKPYRVTYDGRSFLINGRRTIFLSGDFHPPRITPRNWDISLREANQMGLNMIQIYVFWSFHEEKEGQYNFEGRGDLIKFLELCAKHNLFVNMRIGPYVNAEWEYGAIPVWLALKEGVKLRTYNHVWMTEMQRWFEKVVDLTRDHFATNGGPVVLVQVENELRDAPEEYVEWCGSMARAALGENTIPISMCMYEPNDPGQKASNTIASCNGLDCVPFLDKYDIKRSPAMWTENELGFQVWGESLSKPTAYFWGRTYANVSYSITRWFAHGGAHMNYYMFHGGNSYGHWAANSITNGYAYDAAGLCPDGIRNQPKYSNFQRLNAVLRRYAKVLLDNESQHRKSIALSANCSAFLYLQGHATRRLQDSSRGMDGKSGIALLENRGVHSEVVHFKQQDIRLPGKSVQIFDLGLNHVVFNTADTIEASEQRTIRTIPEEMLRMDAWKAWKEPLQGIDPVSSRVPLEQLNLTRGLTDFLVYSSNITLPESALHEHLLLEAKSYASNGLSFFIDEKFIGERNHHSHLMRDVARKFSFKIKVKRPSEHMTLKILSESIGIPNSVNPGDALLPKGLFSLGFSSTVQQSEWMHHVGLLGENLQIYHDERKEEVNWSEAGGVEGIVWFQTRFDVGGDYLKARELLLNTTGLGRGRLYINGHNLGRYWLIEENTKPRPTQSLYHIPQDWLKPKDEDGMSRSNYLVIVNTLPPHAIGEVHLVTSQMESAHPYQRLTPEAESCVL